MQERETRIGHVAVVAVVRSHLILFLWSVKLRIPVDRVLCVQNAGGLRLIGNRAAGLNADSVAADVQADARLRAAPVRAAELDDVLARRVSTGARLLTRRNAAVSPSIRVNAPARPVQHCRRRPPKKTSAFPKSGSSTILQPKLRRIDLGHWIRLLLADEGFS